MNILVCGGKAQADYVLSVFAGKKRNRIVVFNQDKQTLDLISTHYKQMTSNLKTYLTEPTKKYSFEMANVTDFDLMISLQEQDADNFVTCLMAKQMFNIKKTICTVSNPNNVDIFMKLGIDVAISDSYLLAQKIKGESDIESILKTITLENEKLVITEIKIKPEFPCVDVALKDLHLPITGNITCIFRDPEVVIPRGDTVIKVNDTIVIASSAENQQSLIDFIKGK